MSDIYRHADKAIKRLYDEMEREFQNLSVILRFDELNLLNARSQVDAMFKRLDALCVDEYEEVADESYSDAKDEVGATAGKRKKPKSGFVNTVMMAYHPLTKYSYRNEWKRKRDRLVESLVSSRNRLEVRQSLRRSLTLLENQVRQYADIMTDEARLNAFVDAGEDRFKWNTQHDGKVCEVCNERDGQVYKLVDIPTKHHRCRCYLTPVSTGE